MATWPPMVTPEESLMGEQAVTKGPDESMYLHSIGNLGTWLPLYNTVVLLTSSGTVHFAHMALKENNRKRFNFWLGITVLLAFIFVILQALEYYEAYAHLGINIEHRSIWNNIFYVNGISWHACFNWWNIFGNSANKICWIQPLYRQRTFWF